MSVKGFLLSVLFPAILIFAGCSRHAGMKKDAANIADAMCRNIGVIGNLKNTDPEDTLLVRRYKMEQLQIEAEMKTLYDQFKKKYGEKLKDDKFNKEFGKELRKAMLDCPYLSKEDRENFEKQLEE
ncbi:MAG: hypothetical protein Q8867_11130 [Bacteroidota bacterium]|nr:hypothetical protein [Bacteroidota bacterium]